MPSYFPEGDVPQPDDGAVRSWQKIVGLNLAGWSGGGSGDVDNARVTDDGGTRVTDDGGTRIVDA